MDFTAFWKSIPVPERRRLAEQCETSHGFLQNIAYGYRECGALLAASLERATAGAVRRWDMRPTDWYRIWPELIDSPGAPGVPVDASDKEAA